jgi:Ca2+-binding EF-hand superfamily protein
MPSADALLGGQYGVGTPTMKDLDADGDGKVTLAELAGYLRRIGAAPFQVPEGGGLADREQLYYRLAIIQLEQELAFGRVGGQRSADPDSVNDALFKLLDTNSDGKLSKEELAAAPAVLLKRDRNDDEIITPNEIASRAGGAGEAEVQLFLAREALYTSYHVRSRSGEGPFWLARPGASRAELARRLRNSYARSQKQGQPAPTKLSQKDLALDDGAFARLDMDGDGLLDAEELGRFAERPADLELKIDLGPKATVELVKRGTALEASVRPGQDGVLMLELNGTRLDLKSLAAGRVDAVQAAKQEREQYLQAFKQADRDQNGYLDMPEAMRSKLFSNLFQLMDRDGDGMLFEKEVLAYLDTYQELQSAGRACCVTVGISSEGKGLFEMLDADGDGRLSVRELRNAPRLLAELDRNGDGLLSRTEIPRCTQAAFRMGPAASDGSFHYYGSARTVVARRRNQGETPEAVARGPEWFRKMDRNGDGDVSRREFLGTDAQFREIDTDGDGLISVEEAEAYEKKKQEQTEKK